MSGQTSVPTVIAACASTVLAATAIVGLTAAAQEYVLGQERDVAIQLADLRNGQAALEQKIDALLAAQSRGQAADGIVLTQEQIDAAMKTLVEQIVVQLAKQQTQQNQ